MGARTEWSRSRAVRSDRAGGSGDVVLDRNTHVRVYFPFRAGSVRISNNG
jgi:hypothetical protein